MGVGVERCFRNRTKRIFDNTVALKGGEGKDLRMQSCYFFCLFGWLADPLVRKGC